MLEERDLWEMVSGEIKMEQCVTHLYPGDVQTQVPLANKLFFGRRFLRPRWKKVMMCWNKLTRSRRWWSSSTQWALRSARTTW
uniref:Uncharacterized protein n=1 Tax=Hyaloperonospora arabidopsidis (strain Emoy2) TaxID=559515 RepID=M4BDL0_HYAAE